MEYPVAVPEETAVPTLPTKSTPLTFVMACKMGESAGCDDSVQPVVSV
jgi:hypothetical protein